MKWTCLTCPFFYADIIGVASLPCLFALSLCPVSSGQKKYQPVVTDWYSTARTIILWDHKQGAYFCSTQCSGGNNQTITGQATFE